MTPLTENSTVREAAPHIFKRPLLSVSPHDPLPQVATFMAIGVQIYVDGLVVVAVDEAAKDGGGKPVGRIGSRFIIEHILKNPGRWHESTARDVMESPAATVEADSPLRAVFDIFEKTKFAYVPVTAGQGGAAVAVASLSIRDLLGAAVSSDLQTPVGEIASPLIAVDGSKASVLDSLQAMVKRNVRNIAVSSGESGSATKIVNDRKMLEFLLSYDGRQAISGGGLEALRRVRLDSIGLVEGKQVGADTPASRAAELMMDVGTPCLFVAGDSGGGSDGAGRIVTPWDIVMKAFRGRR